MRTGTTARGRSRPATSPPNSRNGPGCPCVSLTSGTRRRRLSAPFVKWAAQPVVAGATSIRSRPPCSCNMRSRFHVRQQLARLALASALATGFGCGGSSGGATVRVTIPPGSTFGAAVDSLAHAHVVSSPRIFRLYASSRGRDRALKAGTYEFQRGASWNEVLDALTRGKGLVHTVTVPEGFALSSIAPLLSRSEEH